MPHCSDLQKICQRIREKSKSYEQYNFTAEFNDFLKAFFDLAQEYDSLDDFYRICVAVPLEMTGLDSALYLLDEDTRLLYLACDSTQGVCQEKRQAPDYITPSREPYQRHNSYIVPIYSKPPSSGADFSQESEQKEGKHRCLSNEVYNRHRLLGVFSVSPLEKLSTTDRFFLNKYTNRIGYNLHNRLISLQNIDHLKFINTLVMDIEHNVIVPNMYFRHLFNKLRKKIAELEALRDEIRKTTDSSNTYQCENCLDRCDRLGDDLLFYHSEIVKHHSNISLFLESLFRREHFESGHLVLHPKRCFVEKEIILPQLENYASRLRAANITVDRPNNMLDEEFQLVVDIGLLSQVYANLFSNATKYTREVVTRDGTTRKALAYGREVINDFPQCGEQGVKFNVFSTGPHLDAAEAPFIFQEGVRGKSSKGIHGTGHGLAFIQHVVELHGGVVGYEQTSEGNNFYFILPVTYVK
ncbi:MAG: HAMP domain-containing sensor histidine kinase [Candidatus Electrothrix aestuarii]|uniref:histidine kinase n=1 Tax=Candidatus Electrothrix aestuarii TaxID=3062594 RepID=A0AAU8M084_9BACT|nr:HAMP domain-containing sensor histidine kinase [Candidatus Electrothrix aestuarii]